MASIKEAFGANNQPIVCTFTSLANAAARASVAIDNSVNLFTEALLTVKIKTGASGTTTTGTVNIYAYASSDGGTTYTEGALGTDAAITLTAPPNAILIGVINCVAVATTYVGGPFPVAAKAFGGILPDHWGIIVENKTGGALDAAVGSAWYQGEYDTVA